MPADAALIQIVDAALAEAARRSGPWLLCRPGCAQCCLGEFPITQLDAQRLQRGLAGLVSREPDRAARVRQRVREAVARPAPMADDDPCAALDPETGTCDLYAARPITCRTFGPPVRCESGDLGLRAVLRRRQRCRNRRLRSGLRSAGPGASPAARVG